MDHPDRAATMIDLRNQNSGVLLLVKTWWSKSCKKKKNKINKTLMDDVNERGRF
jgi:hypothetical protein